MRIVAISDLHSRFSILKGLLNQENADILAVCGDVTDFSKRDVEKFAMILEKFDGKALIVHGNCDFEDAFRDAKGENIEFIHGRSIEMREIVFHGAGGSTYTPFNTPSEYPESYYEKIFEKFDYGDVNILISHCPPYGVLDQTHSGEHAGSRTIRREMHRFDIILCGHVHERKGIRNHGNIVIINPGPLSAGVYAVIDPDEPEKAELAKLR